MNPFAKIANHEHALALAGAFRCLHAHNRDASDVAEQLWAVLRYASLQFDGVTLANYLSGSNFRDWQDANFFEFKDHDATAYQELQELANAWLYSERT